MQKTLGRLSGLSRCYLTQNNSTVALSTRICFHSYASLIFRSDKEIDFPCKFPDYFSFLPFFNVHNLVTLFSFASASFDWYVYCKLKNNWPLLPYLYNKTLLLVFVYKNVSVVIVFRWFLSTFIVKVGEIYWNSQNYLAIQSDAAAYLNVFGNCLDWHH